MMTKEIVATFHDRVNAILQGKVNLNNSPKIGCWFDIFIIHSSDSKYNRKSLLKTSQLFDDNYEIYSDFFLFRALVMESDANR